jgi:hypothetical protein
MLEKMNLNFCVGVIVTSNNGVNDQRRRINLIPLLKSPNNKTPYLLSSEV